MCQKMPFLGVFSVPARKKARIQVFWENSLDGNLGYVV
jgi:hypothetical protein